MKYIGNKFRLLTFIDKVVKKENLQPKVKFCDIFTGTTNVDQFYKKRCYKLITNDIMNYSYVFQYAYIKNNTYPKFEKLIKSKKIKSDKEIITTKYDA